MKRFSVMFASSENHNKWLYDRSDWEQTRKDLNMIEIINYFEKLAKNFPVEYLYKPCLTQEDAEYRLEIMDELLSDEKLFENILDFCFTIRRFKMLLRDYKDDKHEIQKQYRFLLLFGEFTAIASNLKIILSNTKSAGFRAVHDFCSDIISDEKIKSAYPAATNLLHEIGAILNNTGIVINTGKKILTVTECEETGETEFLQEEIFDAYGIKIKNKFSIVDPMPISYLEEKVLEVLIDNYLETFENLEIFYGDYKDNFMDDMKIFADLLPQFIFYITYIEFVKTVKQNNIPVCRPDFDDNGFYAFDCAGIALIIKFLTENLPCGNIIRNDIKLP